MSVKINRRTIERSSLALAKLETIVQEYGGILPSRTISDSHIYFQLISRAKDENSNRLQEEYQNMVRGLREAAEARDADMFLANPVLPDDVLKGTAHEHI